MGNVFVTVHFLGSKVSTFEMTYFEYLDFHKWLDKPVGGLFETNGMFLNKSSIAFYEIAHIEGE